MSLKFKQNDWCFFEFQLNQVKETEENRITSVTDGVINHHGRDLSDRCYPLDLKIKRASDAVSYWRDKFHSLNYNGLNHPDLNRALISLWVDMCESIEDVPMLKRLYDKLNDFGQKVLSSVEDVRSIEVGNVRIFSRYPLPLPG